MLSPISTTASSLFLYLSLASAITFTCSDVQVDKKKFDLSKLGGPRSILVQDTIGVPSKSNTTWTIDICSVLKKSKTTPETPAADQCPNYTRVCGITKTWNPIDDPNATHAITEKVIPVAGEFLNGHGGSLEPYASRLKASNSKAEGISLELNGGRFNNRKQKAIINFICNKKKTGLEGLEKDDDKRRLRARKDEKETDGDDEGDDPPEGEQYVQDPNSALQWVSYGLVSGKEEIDVLRLDWTTKYACEDLDEGGSGAVSGKKSGWGFFTWFILISFLLISAYLIFGSWMNYSRYGARGWDLLPHGDTIRDIPYLFKDWSRKVVETVTGGGSRGGYSAV